VLSKEINVYGKDMDVSPEIKLILLSYFTQLTFGLENYFIGDFDTIYLYEKEFTGASGNKSKTGQTFHTKIIALSWYHFSESHLKVNDGDNLGYYHISQAMVQALKNGDSIDDIFVGYYKTAAEIVFSELENNNFLSFYNNNRSSIKNHDFDSLFPILTELFFDNPIELSKTLPDTYTRLCILYNQDPMAFDQNYELDKTKYRNKKNV
jgi:Mlc titration factor MtfA (ptsG expression regulator)